MKAERAWMHNKVTQKSLVLTHSVDIGKLQVKTERVWMHNKVTQKSLVLTHSVDICMI